MTITRIVEAAESVANNLEHWPRGHVLMVLEAPDGRGVRSRLTVPDSIQPGLLDAGEQTRLRSGTAAGRLMLLVVTREEHAVAEVRALSPGGVA
jgi:hypothetical protein